MVEISGLWPLAAQHEGERPAKIGTPAADARERVWLDGEGGRVCRDLFLKILRRGSRAPRPVGAGKAHLPCGPLFRELQRIDHGKSCFEYGNGALVQFIFAAAHAAGSISIAESDLGE